MRLDQHVHTHTHCSIKHITQSHTISNQTVKWAVRLRETRSVLPAQLFDEVGSVLCDLLWKFNHVNASQDDVVSLHGIGPRKRWTAFEKDQCQWFSHTFSDVKFPTVRGVSQKLFSNLSPPEEMAWLHTPDNYTVKYTTACLKSEMKHNTKIGQSTSPKSLAVDAKQSYHRVTKMQYFPINQPSLDQDTTYSILTENCVQNAPINQSMNPSMMEANQGYASTRHCYHRYSLINLKKLLFLFI